MVKVLLVVPWECLVLVDPWVCLDLVDLWEVRLVLLVLLVPQGKTDLLAKNELAKGPG